MPEQITITCPHCAFRRSVPPQLIPDGAKNAACPKCAKPFPLDARTVSLEAEPPRSGDVNHS